MRETQRSLLYNCSLFSVFSGRPSPVFVLRTRVVTRSYILNAFWKLAAISAPIYRRGTRNAWRVLRGWLGERIACEPLVVATVMLGTSGREHLNNSAVYRRTYSDARAHTPRLWPLLTASWRSLGNARRRKRDEQVEEEEEEEDEGEEE